MVKSKNNTVALSFRSSVVSNFKDEAIDDVGYVPIGSKEAYKSLIPDGTAIYEFVNVIMLGEDHPAYPDPWSKMILTEEWAQSYADGVNNTPAPLFIPGHADSGIAHPKMRAIPDGYVTGARVVSEKLYLRNTLPISGTDEKKALVEQTVREIKAKMLSTSSSDVIKFDIQREEGSYDVVYYAKESVKARSNSLVEADQTGSEAEIVVTSFKQLEAGVADSNKNPEGEGTSMDKDKDKNVTLETMLSSLKNGMQLGNISLKQIEDQLGITILTEERKADLKRLDDVEKILGNVTDFAKTWREDQAALFTSLKDAALKDKFKEDELIETATEMFSLKSGSKEEIDAEVDRIAGFKIFENKLGENASSINANFKQSVGTDLGGSNDLQEMEG